MDKTKKKPQQKKKPANQVALKGVLLLPYQAVSPKKQSGLGKRGATKKTKFRGKEQRFLLQGTMIIRFGMTKI